MYPGGFHGRQKLEIAARGPDQAVRAGLFLRFDRGDLRQPLSGGIGRGAVV